jgi:branched-chain amino acid transport system permease protein
VLQLLVSGAAVGAIYALVAVGFVMIYRATGAVNFAQGDMVTVGAFAALWASRDLGLPILAAWAIAVLTLGLLGATTYRIVYRPLSKHPFLGVAIGTLGLAIMLRASLHLLFGPREAALPSPVGVDTLTLGNVVVGQHLLLVIVVTGLLVTGQAAFFKWTFVGKALRATSEDQEMTQLLGLPTNRLILGTFIYGSMLAAVAGVLLAPIFFVSLALGFSVLLKSFVAAIIGGFGSVTGALVGGLVVGLAEVFGAAYVSTAFRNSFAFAILILILILKPSGLFRGVSHEEKA